MKNLKSILNIKMILFLCVLGVLCGSMAIGNLIAKARTITRIVYF